MSEFACPGCRTRTDCADLSGVFVYIGVELQYRLCAGCSAIAGKKRLAKFSQRIDLALARARRVA